jgi:hypothetical protein
VSWTDNGGNLWLFGGEDNELWKFNPAAKTWTWVSGTNAPNAPGIYGTEGTPSSANVPGSRFTPLSWIDSNSDLWLFGGIGEDSTGATGYLNDLWSYQPSAGTLPTAATPTLSLPPGTYTGPQTVTISDATPGATIYYTSNGTTPTTTSIEYTGAITVSGTETLAAIAVATGYSQSAVATATYTITTGSPVLTLSANSLAFPIQTLNTMSIVQSITVTNIGTASATIPTVAFGGTNPGDFVTSADMCSGTTLAPNASCAIGVTFKPTATTVRSAVLPVGSNPGSSQTAQLTGTGMYGFHQYDASNYPLDVPVCFDNNTYMAATKSCAPDPTTLTYNWGCALTSLGDVLSTFSESATPESLDNYLKSTPDKYADPPSGEMNWCKVPGYLGGAVQLVDGKSFASQSDLQSFLTTEIVTNHRAAVLELCSSPQHCHYVVVTGQGAGDWIIFDPGWANAYDSITDCQNGKTDDALLASLNAHLTGITVDGSTSGCTTYTFSAIAGDALDTATSSNTFCVNALSPVELLITDPSGNQIGSTGQGADIYGIPSASYLRQFPILDAQGSNATLGDANGLKTAYIPSAASGTYALTANGTDFGPFTLDFHFIASDGSEQASTVSGLAGPGSAAAYQISYSPTPGVSPVITPVASGPSAATSANTIQFGSQPVTTTSSPIVLTLGNTGGASLQVLGLSASSGFGQSSNCPSSLASNGTCTISLTFSPSSAGQSTGTLTIASNAPKSPLTVTLTGTGIAITPTVTVTPTSSSITTAQALALTVAVSGGSGSATATGSVTLTSGSYTSSATTLTGGVATINVSAGSLAVGSDILTATYTPDTAGSAIYTGATGSSAQVTVTQATQTITFANPGTQTVGTPLTLSAAASSGLAVSFTSTTTSICTVSGTTATFIASGTCTIDASQSGNSAYAAATMVSQSFTVNGEAQTVTFANPGTQTVGTPLTLSATSTSGLAVSFTSTTTGICTLSGTTATFIVSGTCTIDANQAGNTTYAAAPQVQQSFTVNAAPTFTGSGGGGTISIEPGATTGNTVTISVTPSNGFTGTVNLSCSISPTAASDPATCSLAPSSVTISGSTAQNSTLTINTTAATSSTNKIRRQFWPAAGGPALAVVLFFGVPRRRRSWLAMLGLLVLFVFIGAVGCGGGGGGGGGGNAGTTPGTYTVTVTGTSGSLTVTLGTATLVVQ